MKRIFVLLIALGFLSSGTVFATDGGDDGDDPDLALLPEAPAKEDVFYTCSACHSIKLVAQQRLSKAGWDEMLDWMVVEGGMDELEGEDRELILDYLSTAFSVETPR